MRIIGGSARGRRLVAPAGGKTRPTSDRVREAVFNILGRPPAGARVLDLFAGAGGMGLEALSRGAARADFVDASPAAIRALARNLDALGMSDRAEITRADALRHARKLAGAGAARFHWIFADPPYASGLAPRALALLGSRTLLDSGGVVIVEHDRRALPDPEYGCLIRTDRRRYGDTEVSFFEQERA